MSSDSAKEALASWVVVNQSAMRPPGFIGNFWSDGKSAKHWNRVAKKENKDGSCVRIFTLKSAEHKVNDPTEVYDMPEEYGVVEESNNQTSIRFLSYDDVLVYAKSVGIKKIMFPSIGSSVEVK